MSGSSSPAYQIPDWYPDDCVFGVRLTYNRSRYDAGGRSQAYRLKVTVSDYRGLDPNLFVFRVLVDPHSHLPYGLFDRLASPNDLEEYPVGVPPEGSSDAACYRLSEVDLLFRSPEDLEAAAAAIQADVDELVLTMTSICTTVDEQVVVSGVLNPDLTLEGSSTAGP